MIGAGTCARDGSGSLLKAMRCRCALRLREAFGEARSEEASSGSHRSGCNGRRGEETIADSPLRRPPFDTAQGDNCLKSYDSSTMRMPVGEAMVIGHKT